MGKKSIFTPGYPLYFESERRRTYIHNDIRNDGNIKLLHREMPVDEFWIKIQNEYPNIGEKALVILLQFSTTYLYETAFSVLTNLKTKKRERLLVVEEEMRVALSNVRPNIERICAKNQAQISH